MNVLPSLTGTTCVNATFSRQLKTWLAGNWSFSTAFYPGESRFAAIFEQRVHQAMGLAPQNGGKFQITSYPLDIGNFSDFIFTHLWYGVHLITHVKIVTFSMTGHSSGIF